MRPLLLATTLLAVGLASAPASAEETAKPGAACDALPVEQWERDPLLIVVAATTCAYEVTWNGWSPPRTYRFVADAGGWISDWFFVGESHARVFWNLRTNVILARPLGAGRPVSAEQAREAAAWAKRTLFVGADLATFHFNPEPCPAGLCGPQ